MGKVKEQFFMLQDDNDGYNDQLADCLDKYLKSLEKEVEDEKRETA